MDMIDELNANDRVSRIDFRLSSNIKLNIEIIKVIISRYPNIYYIGILEQSNQIDTKIHYQMK